MIDIEGDDSNSSFSSGGGSLLLSPTETDSFLPSSSNKSSAGRNIPATKTTKSSGKQAILKLGRKRPSSAKFDPEAKKRGRPLPKDSYHSGASGKDDKCLLSPNSVSVGVQSKSVSEAPHSSANTSSSSMSPTAKSSQKASPKSASKGPTLSFSMLPVDLFPSFMGSMSSSHFSKPADND